MESHTPLEDTLPAEMREDGPAEEISLSHAFGGRSILRDIAETLLLTLVIFLVVNSLTGRFQVRGSSMEPSLHSDQYLIVSKLSYRLGEPQRGDIVVFEPPNGATEDYIKRIVGLPGELVEARDNSIWIDGFRLDEPYTFNFTPYQGSWLLGEDEYFVLGDNRDNSSDSSHWGPLTSENLVGKTWLCYWPPHLWGSTPHHEFPETQELE